MLNTSSNQCLYPNKYRAFGGLILQLTSLWGAVGVGFVLFVKLLLNSGDCSVGIGLIALCL